MKTEAASGEKEQGTKPIVIKFGLNHVTTLVENKEAKMVIIAHDVDPIELVLHLPTLCRKQGVAYCFVKNKARLGTFVHQKTATCLALTEVKKEDQADLENLLTMFRSNFNDNTGLRKIYGGGVLGIKHRQMMAKRGNH